MQPAECSKDDFAAPGSTANSTSMNVTLDTNCILDLEEKTEAARPIGQLISMHNRGEIDLRVCAITASEAQPGGECSPTFSIFRDRLASAGLGDATALRPIGLWNMTYWGWGLWASEQKVDLARQIHEILFPGIDFAHPQHSAEDAPRGVDQRRRERRWRNAKCDVLAMWSHIHYGGGVS